MSVPATSPTPTPAAKAEKATEPGLLDRYLALGTAVRLAIAVGIALVLWLFAEDYIWSAARSIDATCDAMQKSLEEGAERSQLVERSESVKEAIVSIGPIAIPRSEKDGSACHTMFMKLKAQSGHPAQPGSRDAHAH